MPRFLCQVCQADFEVPEKALEKYPGWTPRYCREHSPRKGKATRKAGGREENRTRAQVLRRSRGGPKTGVFTDGSARPNPGPGGWGVVWVQGEKIRAERHGHEAHTTNNRMELVALIEAYKLLPEDASVPVISDSQLCVNTITKWAPSWERRGWKRKDGPIKNLELVRELLALYRRHPRCPLEWIKAHAGNRWNEYADSLATAWRRDVL